MKDLIFAIKSVLTEKMYLVLFLLLIPIIFLIFILIPVLTIPGNDIAFQLSIYRPQDFILMSFLTLLVSLNFSANIYVWKKQGRRADMPKSTTSGATAGFGGIMGAVVGTAACSSCLASLFGIVGLGFGSVAFVLKYQTLFLLVAVVLILLSLYFTLRKVSKHCLSCPPETGLLDRE